MKTSSLYSLFTALLCLLTLACTDDAPREGEVKGKVRIDLSAMVNAEVSTRAYTEWTSTAADRRTFAIVAQTPVGNQDVLAQGLWRYMEDVPGYQSNLWLGGGQYRFFAFTPSYSASSNADGTLNPQVSFTSAGGNMQADISNCYAFGKEDLLLSSAFCADAAGATPADNAMITIAGTEGKRTIDFYMDHLLAKLNLCFYVENEYADLREIDLKSVSLQGAAANASVAYSFSAQYNGNDKGFTRTAVTPVTTSAQPLKWEKTLRLTTEAQQFCTAYFLPEALSSTHEMLATVTYDVYDKKTHETRHDVVATSHVKVNSSLPQAGHSYTVNVRVVPTYIYVLSDADMDNPTIKL